VPENMEASAALKEIQALYQVTPHLWELLNNSLRISEKGKMSIQAASLI
jgi:hypothetical protein